jgi:predicted small secreted protein
VKRIVLWSLLVVWGLVISGCHTVQGAGEDIQHGGEAIQDVAH